LAPARAGQEDAVAFAVRFVSSEEVPVVLAPDDADELLEGLRRNFAEDDLGIPHLVGRLKDGRDHEAEIDIDEREAGEVLVAIESIEVNGGEPSPRLEALRHACVRYRRDA
jgi:hypothetical protein